jgi:hypothetical protein
MYDGNYVIASGLRQPWRKQFNILLAYMFFYNPLRAIGDLLFDRGRLNLKPAAMQLVGMLGLVYTIRRTLGWGFRLLLGRVKRCTATPGSPLPMQPPEGAKKSDVPPR